MYSNSYPTIRGSISGMIAKFMLVKSTLGTFNMDVAGAGRASTVKIARGKNDAIGSNLCRRIYVSTECPYQVRQASYSVIRISKQWPESLAIWNAAKAPTLGLKRDSSQTGRAYRWFRASMGAS